MGGGSTSHAVSATCEGTAAASARRAWRPSPQAWPWHFGVGERMRRRVREPARGVWPESLRAGDSRGLCHRWHPKCIHRGQALEGTFK